MVLNPFRTFITWAILIFYLFILLGCSTENTREMASNEKPRITKSNFINFTKNNSK